MRKQNMKIYIREYSSKLEFWNNMNLVILHNKIKSKIVKKLYNIFIRICININFIIKYLYQKIYIKNIGNERFILILPIKLNNLEKYKFKKIFYNKCINNVSEIIDKYNIECIILSKKLYEIDDIKSICNLKNINIIKEKYLFKLMLPNVLEYIFNIREELLQNQNLHILVKENSKININLIEHISGKVKCVNIVTNEIKKFQKLEKYLYEEKGIMTVVSNNKRKSLQKAKVIINLDLGEDELLKYQINRNSIIINISDNKIKLEKSFNGIVINSFEIEDINNYYITNQELFNNIILYTSFIYNKDYQNIVKRIKEDGIIIKSLIGERGKIQKIEYTKIT